MEKNQKEVSKEEEEEEQQQQQKITRNENKEKLEVKNEDIQQKPSELKSKKPNLRPNTYKCCYNCMKETGTYVSYECNHFLCEGCFKFKYMEIEEEVIFCNCEIKGRADIYSINEINIHNNIRKRLNDIYKTPEKVNDDNDKLIQNENSALYNEKKVQCYQRNHTVKANITIKCEKCHLRFCFTCLSEKIQMRYNKSRDSSVIFKCLNDNCSSIIEFYNLKQVIPQQLFSCLQEELMNPNTKQQPYEKKLSESLDIKQNSEIVCEVCFETKKFQDCLNLDCNHIFCKTCLQEDYTLKINNGQIDKTFIKCMKTDCGQEIKYDTLEKILDKNIFEKYEYISKRFSFNEISSSSEKKIEPKQIMKRNPKEKEIFEEKKYRF